MSEYTLPKPPVLKTTIIQLNKELDSDDNNYEILTNEYSGSSNYNSNNNAASLNQNNSKKKRRRSSANIDSEELAKRKHETKQLHSIIEKRRRIKINREFEALKYLIPACRSTTPLANQKGRSSGSNGNNNAGNNNGNKIDGMYKLTILKSSVEYILYLHHIIQQQHNLLNSDSLYNFDIEFSKIPLDVNQYRNIDKDFNFKDLLNCLPSLTTSTPQEKKSLDIEDRIVEEDFAEDDVKNQLPSPEITPNMAPILSMSNKYIEKKNSNQTSPNSLLPYPSMNNSPVSLTSSAADSNKFSLPDPAINPSIKISDNNEHNHVNFPKKKLFKSKVPLNNKIISKYSNDYENYDDILSDHDALRTLLSLRKSSIDSLLN